MIEDDASMGSLMLLILLILIYFSRPWLYWPR
jgi:hypothetical protein